MSGSYTRINYTLRPAKHAERMMLAETFSRLRFYHPRDYQYIGLGSIYFADFLLFHRILGIRTMINIEEKVGDKPRFEFNAPLYIDLRFGNTGQWLPKLNVSRPTIAWLDYDGRLEPNMLNDINTFASRSGSGNVLLVTVQCLPEVPSLSGAEEVSRLEGVFGADHVPRGLKDKDLVGEGTARLFRYAMQIEMENAIADRNALIADSNEHFEYEQILNIRYEDGVAMMTVGWVLFTRADRRNFDLSDFPSLEFYSNTEVAFAIRTPRLTQKEVKYLQAQLPLEAGVNINSGCIPPSDARDYAKIYRYFPEFHTTDWN